MLVLKALRVVVVGIVEKVVDVPLEDHLALDLLHLVLEVGDARSGRGGVDPGLVEGRRIEGALWQLVSDREGEQRVF